METTADEKLVQKKCVACEGFETPLNKTEAEVLMKQLHGWKLSGDAKSISKSIEFKDFAGALAMANKCGAIFEEEGHHPDLLVAWGKLTITTWTHAIGGLSENDFIVAAKIDQLID